MKCKLLEVQTPTEKKESFEEDTYIDRHRYLARRAKNEGRKRRVKQESDLSEIAKTDTSLFAILGQFGSPQFSIILKISTCLGLGNLLLLVPLPQSRRK